MTQSGMFIGDVVAPQARQDLNEALEALATLSTGSTAPTTTFANMFWYDTSENQLKKRTADNASWETFTLGDAVTVGYTAPSPRTYNNLKDAVDGAFSVAGITAEEIGLVGDGSDETTLLNTLFSAGKYNRVILENGKNYGYDPTVGLTIVGPIEIVSNGAVFTETAANTTEAVSFTGRGLRADTLTFNFIGSAGSEAAERGITIDADDVDIGILRLLAATAGTGAGPNTRNAVDIGPASGTRKENVKIGLIECENWDRPVVCQRLQNSKIDRIVCKTYLRAVYVTDCIGFDIFAGKASGASPNILGRAGENGILINVQEAHYATRNVRIYNFDVEDSGEHGFRIGGGLSAFGIWHVNCSAIRSGSGVGSGSEPDDHGGCGFKCLGPTGSNARHENIYYVNCTVEDVILDVREGINHVGFYIGKILSGGIINPIVRKRNETYSAYHGFTIIGCENYSIVNPIVADTKAESFYFWGAASGGSANYGLTINFTILGGISNLPGGAHVTAAAADDTMRRITISDLEVVSGTHALKATADSGGFTGCSANFICWGLGTALLDGTDGWAITARGQIPSTIGPAAPGSSISRWNDTFKIRQASAWVDLDSAEAIRYTGTPGITTVEGQLDYFIQAVTTVDLTSAAYNASWGETLVLTAGANDVNLPAAGDSSRKLRIVNKTGGAITLSPDGTDSTEVTSVADGASVLLADIAAGGNDIVEV